MPASVQFVDIGGLVEGASTGEGLGNQFLAHIREVDAIVFVLRAFVDNDVPGPVDPLERLRVLEIELALADLEIVEKQVEKRRKAAKQDKSLAEEVDALGRGPRGAGRGHPDLPQHPRRADRVLLAPYFLLTNKPVLALVNVGEDDLERIDELIAPVVAELGGQGEVIGMCVQLEAEAAQFDAEGRLEMLEALGLGEGAPAPVPPRRLPPARPAHVPHHGREGVPGLDVPGRVEGPAVRRASSTPTSSAGFIRAEVIHWDELLELGSWSKARDVGKLRVEGKDYEVADGDVLEFRFNV